MLKDAGNPGRARGSLLAMSVGQLLEMLPWMVDMREGPVLVDALETVWKLSNKKKVGVKETVELPWAIRESKFCAESLRFCTSTILAL